MPVGNRVPPVEAHFGNLRGSAGVSGTVSVMELSVLLNLHSAKTALAMVVAALLLWGIGSACAEPIITGVEIEDVSSEFGGRVAENTLNGSGFDPLTGEHNTSTSAMWLSLGSSGPPNDPHVADGTDSRLAHIVFDLGRIYDVSSFHVWNYNEEDPGSNPNRPARSIQDLEILISETSDLAGFDAGGSFIKLTDPSDSDQTFTFAQAPGDSGYTGEQFNVGFRARYVRFDIFSNHPQADNNFVGLSEIRFTPEPTALVLLGVVGLALLWQRPRGQ